MADRRVHDAKDILSRTAHRPRHTGNATAHHTNRAASQISKGLRQAADRLVHDAKDILSRVAQRPHHRGNAVLQQGHNVFSEVQPVECRKYIHNRLYDLRKVGYQSRNRVPQSLAQRDNQPHARLQQLRCVIIDDTRQIRHDPRQIGNQRGQPVGESLRHMEDKRNTRIDQLPGVCTQTCSKIRGKRQRLFQQGRNAGYQAIPQASQHSKPRLQKLRSHAGG